MLVLSALALAFALAPASRASSVSPRIVNGTDASINDFPYQVALYNPLRGTPSQAQYCGGVILDALHVLTAAHCVFDAYVPRQVSHPVQVHVLAGTDNLANTSGAMDIEAAEVAFDPDYDPATNNHDVALITLSSRLWPETDHPSNDGSTPIAPIQIIDDTAFQDDLDSTSASTPVMATVSGWGDTDPQDPLPPPGTPPIHKFPDQLQAADIPLIDEATCQSDFTTPPLTAQITGTTLFCAGDDQDSTNLSNKDSCQGDSGGPLVIDPNQTAPHTDVQLAGLVDAGFGCAWYRLPGIYTRVSDSTIGAFIHGPPPAAPSQVGPVVLTGGSQPGQTLTCHSDPWSDPTANLTYQFFTTSGSPLTNPSADGTAYTIQQSDLGSRILCEVEAKNAGGYGFADSLSVLVPVPPAPPPPTPVPKDKNPPKLSIKSKKCTKTACTLKVSVTDPGTPSSGVARVSAKLSFTKKVSCRKHGKRTTCNKRVRRTLKATGGSGGRFTIVVKHLTPGKGYQLSLVPFDKAGNRPQFSTITNVRTKPRHTRLA